MGKDQNPTHPFVVVSSYVLLLLLYDSTT